MRPKRSIRVRRVVPLVAAMALVIACSSDSVTGPSTRQNATLILHFDSLMNSTSGDRPATYSAIAEMLAEGAPVGTGTITVDGTTRRMNMVAQLNVGMLNGAPFDSEYTVAAWKGDGADTVILLIQSGGTVSALSALGAASGADFGGTATVMPGALGASCTTFTAPGDIDVPTPLDCQIQTSQDSFTIVLGGGQGPTVTVPNQPVVGIRLETAAPPPPC